MYNKGGAGEGEGEKGKGEGRKGEMNGMGDMIVVSYLT